LDFFNLSFLFPYTTHRYGTSLRWLLCVRRTVREWRKWTAISITREDQRKYSVDMAVITSSTLRVSIMGKVSL
jgi:hypothetical protein